MTGCGKFFFAFLWLEKEAFNDIHGSLLQITIYEFLRQRCQAILTLPLSLYRILNAIPIHEQTIVSFD